MKVWCQHPHPGPPHKGRGKRRWPGRTLRRIHMPHFEEFYANKLLGSLGVVDAEAVLDLRGASRDKAAASIQDMLERSRFARGKTVAIRLDPPPVGKGER